MMGCRKYLTAAAALLCSAGAVVAQTGPDVIVGDLPSVRNWGVVGNIRAYSIATTSCNIGTQDLLWIANNNQHPVIGQHLYRIANGRIEMIGQSWLKHGFTAINNGICGQCNGHLGSVLGVGCSDPYGSSLNGEQPRLGPKSEVNASTGFYPYPYGIAWQQSGNTIFKRLQVDTADIADTNGVYILEGHYVTRDDADAGNKNNNASYRRCTIASTGNITVRDSTERQSPAIYAWQKHGLGANVADPNVFIKVIDVPNDGRIFLAYKVSDNGDGTWNYQYAIQNLSSHRSVGALDIAKGAGANITNIAFHDVPYHSGEPYDGTDWPGLDTGSAVSWSTNFANTNANAIRWGTLYNFSFDSDTPPESGNATLTLFRPGTPSTVSSAILVPSAGDIACPADCDDNGVVNASDVGCFLSLYFDDIANGTFNSDCDANGTINAADVGCFLNLYFANLGNCP